MALRPVQKLAVTGLDDPNQRRRLVETVNQITEAPTWATPTLLNSWVNYGSGYAEVGYYRDALGCVRLRGFIRGGTTTDTTPLLILPAGYRPLSTHVFPAVQAVDAGGVTSDNVARIDVGPDGTVAIYNVNAAADWISLAVITFLAEQ